MTKVSIDTADEAISNGLERISASEREDTWTFAVAWTG
jgi:hypothetical protein